LRDFWTSLKKKPGIFQFVGAGAIEYNAGAIVLVMIKAIVKEPIEGAFEGEVLYEFPIHQTFA
jgi:hypothetical protein